MVGGFEHVHIHQLRVFFAQVGDAAPRAVGGEEDAALAKGDVQQHRAVVHAGHLGPVIIQEGEGGVSHLNGVAAENLAVGHPFFVDLGHGGLVLLKPVIHRVHGQEKAGQIILDDQLALGQDVVSMGMGVEKIVAVCHVLGFQKAAQGLGAAGDAAVNEHGLAAGAHQDGIPGADVDDVHHQQVIRAFKGIILHQGGLILHGVLFGHVEHHRLRHHRQHQDDQHSQQAYQSLHRLLHSQKSKQKPLTAYPSWCAPVKVQAWEKARLCAIIRANSHRRCRCLTAACLRSLAR